MPTISPSLREPVGVSAKEIDLKARGLWETIAEETGNRRTHAQKVARFYLVARDLQDAITAGASAATVWEALKFLAKVTSIAFTARAMRLAR